MRDSWGLPKEAASRFDFLVSEYDALVTAKQGAVRGLSDERFATVWERPGRKERNCPAHFRIRITRKAHITGND